MMNRGHKDTIIAVVLFIAIIVVFLTGAYAIFYGVPSAAPKPTPAPTDNPLIHGGLGTRSDLGPALECKRDFMIPVDQQKMMALVLVEIPKEDWPEVALSRDFAGTVFQYVHDDGVKFNVGFWDRTHEWIEVVMIIGIYELCTDGTVDFRVDETVMYENPRTQ